MDTERAREALREEVLAVGVVMLAKEVCEGTPASLTAE